MSNRAKAAYFGYCKAVHEQNGCQNPLPTWEELPECRRHAWDAACGAVLRYWLEHDFREAVKDDYRIGQFAAAILAVGVSRGDTSTDCLRHSIAAFVVHCIAPEELVPVTTCTK